jgi:hypothetical protein
MTFQINIKAVDGNWRTVSIPDDINANIKMSGETLDMYFSVEDIVRLYSTIANGVSDEFSTGYGDVISINASEKDEVILSINSRKEKYEKRQLKEEVSLAVKTVFMEKNQTSNSKDRAAGLDILQSALDHYQIDTDCRQLYRDLIN